MWPPEKEASTRTDIIDTCGYGVGHRKHGCSNSVMDTWTGLFDEAGGVPGSCE